MNPSRTSIRPITPQSDLWASSSRTPTPKPGSRRTSECGFVYCLISHRTSVGRWEVLLGAVLPAAIDHGTVRRRSAPWCRTFPDATVSPSLDFRAASLLPRAARWQRTVSGDPPGSRSARGARPCELWWAVPSDSRIRAEVGAHGSYVMVDIFVTESTGKAAASGTRTTQR